MVYDSQFIFYHKLLRNAIYIQKIIPRKEKTVYNELLATLFGFLAVVFIVTSYFVSNKTGYLFFQLLNMLSFALSYLFCENYFAMVGLTVSAIRTVTFFVFEKKGKDPSIWLAVLFSAMAVAAWAIVNVVILDTAAPVDILLVIAMVCYNFIFKIRNLNVVRYTMIFPLCVSILYNILSWSTVFAVCSYSFELAADIISIIKEKTNSRRTRKLI